MKTFLKILLISLLFFSCTSSKKTIVGEKKSQDKLPIYLKIYPNTPPDSLIDFIRPFWQTKKISVISYEEMLALGKEEIKRLTSSTLAPSFDKPQAYTEFITTNANYVSNNLSLKFFMNAENVDSIQWSIYNLPVNTLKDKKDKLHTFIPKGQKHFFISFKEFTDTLIQSKDYL
jgi:hypothetical protein